jgi:hypothetical protein
MPVTYSFSGDVLEISAVGTYPADEVTRAFRDAIADPNRPPLRALLYDVRESSVITSRSTPDVQAAISFFQSLAPHIGGRVALLASSDAAYGIMRMVAGWAAAAALEAKVFRDRAAALEWAAR